jgi:sugar lactone lactonase YvrE
MSNPEVTIMRPSTISSPATRLGKCLIPVLLAAAGAGCGGGGGDWAVVAQFGDGFDDHHHHHHGHHDDDPPPPDQDQPPPPDPGLFLFAGDVCQCGGTLDGTGPAARFNDPTGIAADSNGNLYVTDRGGATIRKITPQAVVTTLAGNPGVPGSADGTGDVARFDAPTRLTAGDSGNLYVTDTGNSTIRRVSANGAVTTLAGKAGECGSADGGPATARFCGPQGIVQDGRGNLFVTDTLNHTVRRIDPGGTVTTVAGTPGVCGSADGHGGAARFCQPQDITIDAAGNLFVADTANSTIRWITPKGDVITIAGRPGECGAADGNAAVSRLCRPNGVKVDMATNDIYVADAGNATIRKITTDNAVSTVAGVAGSNAIVLGPLPGGLANPLGIGLMGNGTIAVTANNLILKVVQPR